MRHHDLEQIAKHLPWEEKKNCVHHNIILFVYSFSFHYFIYIHYIM